jgi:sulfide:quinone oxidoreductase
MSRGSDRTRLSAGGPELRRLVVLGAGTAGTMLANRLARRLDDDWQIVVVEPSDVHHYQPGFLLLPFGEYAPHQLERPVEDCLDARIDLRRAEVDHVATTDHRVVLADGTQLSYDYLVVATGVTPRPDQVPGLLDDLVWHRSAHEFYTLDGALALRDALREFRGGRVLVHVAEMPVKCPVAPLEMAFLLDDRFRRLGHRERLELTYVTPLPGAFTKPVASARLSHMLDDRDIRLETDFVVDQVDPAKHTLVSYDGRELPFDLLVTVPPNLGADFVARSRLGDELNLVPVDPRTFLATGHENVFAIGDACDIPTSKAGSVAHFSVDVFVENFLEHAAGRPMTHAFDGHANCFVESGDGKALLLDFNYDTQPLPGTYPVPALGPFHLLEETRLNHWGKLAFRWAYWHVLLPGRSVPLPSQMSMSGKKPEHAEV